MSCRLRLAALPLLGLFLAWYGATQLSISPDEARLVFQGTGPQPEGKPRKEQALGV